MRGKNRQNHNENVLNFRKISKKIEVIFKQQFEEFLKLDRNLEKF